MVMKRREFLRKATIYTGGAFAGGAAFSLGGNCYIQHAAAQGLRKEKWMSPSSITPLQCYAVIAKEKGFFEAEGLDITIQPSPGTASAVTQVAAGQAMFSQSAAITTVPAIANQGAEIITVGQVIYKSVFEIASKSDKPITHPRDWQGKTIGVMSVGGSTDLLLDAMTVAAGLDPKNVKKVVTGISAGSFAFLDRGQVDGFWAFYPVRIALETQGIKLHYLNSDEFAPIPPDNIIVSKTALSSEADRKAVVSYLKACAKAMHFLLDAANYDEITNYLGKYNAVEAQDRVAAKQKFAFVGELAKRPANVPFMHCDDEAWAKGVDLMKKIAMIKADAPPATAYYTNDLVKQI